MCRQSALGNCLEALILPKNSMIAASFPAVFMRKARSAGWRLKWRLMAELYRLPAMELDRVAPTKENVVEEPIMDDICMPPFYGGHPHDDFGALLRISKNVCPNLICEIGTAHGNLAANLLRACPQATLVTVNAPAELQTGTITTYELTVDEIGRVYRKYGYQNRVVQLFVNSLDLDLSPHTTSSSVDLAIIDGCHDEEFVLNDFEKVRPYVRPGGAVLLHDTHPSQRGHLASSYRACLVLRKRGFDIRWIRDTWWGYWNKPQ